MEFRFIDEGTRLDVQQKDAPDAPMYYGIFEKMDKGVSFLVSCDPLFEHFDQLDLNKIYVFTFFRGAEIYTFDGKLVEKQRYIHKNVLLVTATTLISTHSRRGSHRIRAQMAVNLHEVDESQPDQPGALVCAGVMHDVSRGGLTFLLNDKIPLELRKTYLADFSVGHANFRFPVEFVRGSERSLSPLYRYDYAFMYNGENLTDALNKLTLALFEQQLRGGGAR
ncbi:MAG: hypothetical protein FWB88_05650 [Defluviitaleaceae bacterium]|nr:hypothetical protein [Defluviitaleaceae bacterium]MCL2239583.1 hypothetical protein [Defluviitaleaceae bacterium]